MECGKKYRGQREKNVLTRRKMLILYITSLSAERHLCSVLLLFRSSVLDWDVQETSEFLEHNFITKKYWEWSKII